MNTDKVKVNKGQVWKHGNNGKEYRVVEASELQVVLSSGSFTVLSIDELRRIFKMIVHESGHEINPNMEYCTTPGKTDTGWGRVTVGGDLYYRTPPDNKRGEDRYYVQGKLSPCKGCMSAECNRLVDGTVCAANGRSDICAADVPVGWTIYGGKDYAVAKIQWDQNIPHIFGPHKTNGKPSRVGVSSVGPTVVLGNGVRYRVVGFSTKACKEINMSRRMVIESSVPVVGRCLYDYAVLWTLWGVQELKNHEVDS